jgi:hypothetical protein
LSTQRPARVMADRQTATPAVADGVTAARAYRAANRQNSLPSGSAITTQGSVPLCPMSALRAPEIPDGQSQLPGRRGEGQDEPGSSSSLCRCSERRAVLGPRTVLLRPASLGNGDTVFRVRDDGPTEASSPEIRKQSAVVSVHCQACNSRLMGKGIADRPTTPQCPPRLCASEEPDLFDSAGPV